MRIINAISSRTIYLKATNAAKALRDRDAGVEFSIKKAHHHRYKNLALVEDRELPVTRRYTRGTAIVGNYSWHAVCGYAYRLWRIPAASVVVTGDRIVLTDEETTAEQAAALGSLVVDDGGDQTTG